MKSFFFPAELKLTLFLIDLQMIMKYNTIDTIVVLK